VETATYEQAQTQLEEARRAGAQKDQQIRAFQWQLAVLDQQFRAAEQRNEAVQQALSAQLQKLGAVNLELSERLSKAERERAALAAAASAFPLSVKDAHTGRHDGTDDLRRIIAATDARNAQILEELARIERLLGSREAVHREGPRATTNDVIDPWGFGSRK